MKMTLDKLAEAVAIEVMGWELCHSGWYDSDSRCEIQFDTYGANNFTPEHDANHRDMVIDKMTESKWIFACYIGNSDNRNAAVFSTSLARPHGATKMLQNLTAEIEPLIFNGSTIVERFIREHKNIGVAVMLAAYEAHTGQRVEV